MIYLKSNKDIIAIKPDFIYNRFDLFCPNQYILLFSDKSRITVEVQLKAFTAHLGLWMVKISREEINALCQYIFKSYPRILAVDFSNTMIDLKGETNHFHINLPQTETELLLRLSPKSRYNLKREVAIVKKYYRIDFVEYSNIPDSIVKLYFEFKKITHNKEYKMSIHDYLNTYHVSNAYTLSFDNEIVAILLTCEQCSVVYLENLAYDINFAKFSPGKIAYNLLLKKLINKKKVAIFLGGGDYEYKRKYGSIESKVTSDLIFRNGFSRSLYYLQYIPNRIKWKLHTIGLIG